MKRPLIIGILVFIFLLIGGGGALAYVYVVRPAMSTVNAARDLAQIQQLENRVRDRSVYAAPGNGVLEAAQVERYLSASRSIVAGLKGQLGRLEDRYEQIEVEGRDPNLRELARAYADILRLVVDAKELQVEALNANDFSLSEYAWVRGQVIRAAGFETYQVDLTALANDSSNTAVRELSATVPTANVELVRPYAEELEEMLPLAAFGL